MKYIQSTFEQKDAPEYLWDLLADELGRIGYESFVNKTDGLDAYIPENLFDAKKINQLLDGFQATAEKIDALHSQIEDKDWNEEWEKHYFQPIRIGEQCVVHSSFHTNYAPAEFEIIIDPKMAFGTGHHQTTELMIRELLKMELTNLSVLDMGCGTSILAILVAKKGAKPIVAIDIDKWCVENSAENIALNGVENIEVKLGNSELLKGYTFDLIIANINRNILLEDIPAYSKSLNHGGELLLSGFYTEDIPVLEKRANEFGLSLLYARQEKNWSVMKLKK